MAKKVEYIISLKDKTKAGLASAKKGFSNLTSRVKSGVKNMKASLSGLGGVVAGAFSVGAILNFGKKILDTAAEIQAVSDRANIGAEAMQAFAASAQRGGATISEVNIALVTLRKQQQNAINGMPEAVKAFEALGISIEQVASSTNEELLEAVAKGIKATGDFGNGFKLMGESTARVHNAIDELADKGIVNLIEKYDDLNQVMSDKNIKRLEMAKNNVDEFIKSLTILVGGAIGQSMKTLEKRFILMMNPLSTREERISIFEGNEAERAATKEAKEIEAQVARVAQAKIDSENAWDKAWLANREKNFKEAAAETAKREAKNAEARKKNAEKDAKDRIAYEAEIDESLSEAMIDSIKDEHAKEIAQIGKELQEKLKSIKGNSDEEMALRLQLATNAQKDIEKLLQDAKDEEKKKEDNLNDEKIKEDEKRWNKRQKKIKSLMQGKIDKLDDYIDNLEKSPDERKAEAKAARKRQAAVARAWKKAKNPKIKISTKDRELLNLERAKIQRSKIQEQLDKKRDTLYDDVASLKKAIVPAGGE